MQMPQRTIHGFEVPPHHLGTPFSIGFLDCFLDLYERFVGWQNPGDREIAGLHDGVDAPAHAGGLRYGHGIDRKEADLLFDDLLLQLAWQTLPDLAALARGIEQEHSSWGSV